MSITRKLCKNCFAPKSRRGECPVCGYTKGAGDPSLLPRGAKLAGRYIVGGAIGRGGFGVTYLAYDTNDKKTVAVKEYFPSMLAKRDRGAYVIPVSEKSAVQFNIGAEKFFDEADLVRQFNGNPNIISIYECFYENNTAYYIMEYLDGITLDNYVKKYGVLSPAEAAFVADKLSMALVVLHSGSVLHRDISPDNVMLCKNGNVKLVDFGAARQFLSDGTLGYTVIMKPGFSPLEQYSHDTEPDIRADIYSAGTLLYYALTGNIPESPYKRMENDNAFCGKAADDGKSGLWRVIEKSAAVMPSERYQSAEELRSELAKLDITASAVAVPTEYNSLNDERFAGSRIPKKHTKAWLIAAACSVCSAAAIVLIINVARENSLSKKLPENGIIELTLDDEYAGHFNIGGRIPASELKRFGGDVEITLKVKPWEDMDPENICGLIPVNSNDGIMLEYLFAANELWADANGWISVDSGIETVTLVLSEEGVENLSNGELCFEMYNLIITSAELKRADKKLDIGVNDWYELRNAAYSVSEDENGKNVDVPLSENRIQSWPSFESQAIPKSAFYEIDGDVKVTLTLEALECPEDEQLLVCVSNSGYCFDVMNEKILVPEANDSKGNPLVKLDHYNNMMLARGCKELTFVIPESAKEKMSSGIFFQCMGVRVTQARLESYNGEYDEFL